SPNLDESSRIAALMRYRNLDYSSNSEFQTITQLAADICETSISVITFVDEEKVDLLFTHGIEGVTCVSKDISFCEKTVHKTALVEVPDTRLDPEFKNSSLVIGGPKILFYTGMPLITYDGYTIGTLCVMDRQPKKLSSTQINSLTQLSKIVIKLFDAKLIRSLSRTNESFIQAIDEIVYDHDLLSNGLKWSGAYTRILGFSAEEMGTDGNSWLSKVHQDDLPAVLAELEAVKKEHRLYDLEYRFARCNGDYLWMHDRGVIHFDKDGQALQVVGIMRNVNKRKLIEAEKREQEYHSRLFFNHAPICIHGIDLQGCFTSMNPSGLAMLELTDEKYIIGMPYLSGVAEKDYDRIKHLLEKALQGENATFEFTGTSGKIYSSCFVPIKNDQGTVTKLMGISEDITERKHAEQDLREMNTALTHSLQGIARLDLNGHYTYVNNIYASLLGYIPEELVGQSWKITVDPDDINKGVRGYQQMLKEENVEFNIKGVRKDGSSIFKHVLISKRLDNEGAFIGHRCFMKDISAQVEIEKQHKQLQNELNHVARLSNMNEMATGLAHEINQPLSAITHYCDAAQSLLASQSISNDMLSKILQGASEEAYRAGEIIRHCRQFVSKQTMDKFIVNLNELTQETVRYLSSDVQEQNISIQVTLDDNLPAVQIDKVQIQQVLVNLIRNGLEAMQNNNGKSRKLTVYTHLNGKNANAPEAQVTVADTGPGLGLSQIDNLFQPFYTTKKSGMGMGLSISRSIIDAHGGKLWLDSQHTSETQFHFTLPIETEQTV
ncbi:MAG: PAS domain S-box protein, partial [Gammaproteobacteria bacterium]